MAAVLAADNTQTGGPLDWLASAAEAVDSVLAAAWQGPNDLLGGYLGDAIGGSPGQSTADGAIIHNDVQSFTRGFVVDVLGGGNANAVTIGNHILVAGTPMEEGSHWYEHEVGHVDQARALGPLYLPAYVAGLALAGLQTRSVDARTVHDAHPMEMLAAGRALEVDSQRGILPIRSFRLPN